ncbi:MAG: nucleotidyl transferase AbiEii/AbiGii toxin family protein [bacterium]
MLLFNLQRITEVYLRRSLPTPVIRNYLKEHLQLYILDFVYNRSYGKELIFTGGSCLRFCFGLNRVSEDLDFDRLSDLKSGIGKSALAGKMSFLEIEALIEIGRLSVETKDYKAGKKALENAQKQ